jgi:DNA repair protein RadC
MGKESVKDKNLHGDHRKRVRERFMKSGLAGFPDHNVLEFVLFYSQPYGDTNETAHRLLETFGSLSSVLDAPYEELVKVKGVGSYTAVFLTMLPQLAKRYFSDMIPDRVTFTDRKSLLDYIRAEYISETSETAKLLCFNNGGLLINCCKVSIGSKNSVSIDRRTLLETAFRNSASSVILTHNHPNGMAVPSQNDIVTTKEVFRLFSDVNIRMLDHVIVSGNDLFSMAESPKFGIIFI